MSPKELYEFAKENGAENAEIEYLHPHGRNIFNEPLKPWIGIIVIEGSKIKI